MAKATRAPPLRIKRLRRLAAGLQYGALPFQVADDGTVSFLMVTSRETRRWVIPKGWPMSKRNPRQAAAQEAWEEAGVTGRMISKRPIGLYRYQKRLSPSVSVACTVKVFLLAVEQQFEDWPEQAERDKQWFDPREAATLVEEAALGKLMLKAATKLRQVRRGTRHGGD